METGIAPLAVVLAATIASAITDVWKYKVYNALTVPLVLSGLAYHGATQGASGLSTSAVGMLSAFVVLFVPYLLGAMGAGDVKLAAGLGAWLGAPMTLSILLVGCLATGIYGVAVMARRGGLRNVWLNLQLSYLRLQTVQHHFKMDEQREDVRDVVKAADRRGRLIPFTLMIGIGVVVTLVWGSVL